MFTCSKCTVAGCKTNEPDKFLKVCPSKNEAVQEDARLLIQDEENGKIARSAAIVEAEGYGSLCRMEEVLRFCNEMEYHKLGLVFCMGLRKEAAVVDKILSRHGYDVCSAVCKNGAIAKSTIGITAEQTLSGCADEIMCNPIGQALVMNKEEVEFTIMLGLCVGHDSLVLKYLEAPATVLAVKDRVTGHNPLAAIYMADGYYKKKFFGDTE